MPGHLAAVTHVCEAELSVLLVAPSLLALTARVDVVSELAISAAKAVVLESPLEQRPLVEVDGGCHHHLHGRGVPIAVCERSEVVDDRQEYLAEHPAEAIRVLDSPAAVRVPHQLGGVHHLEAAEGCAENGIGAGDTLQRCCPRVQDTDGYLCVRGV